MAIRRTRLFSLLVTTAFLFTACVKEGVSVNPDAKKLTRIEYEGGSYEAVEYNTDGTLKKIVNHEAYVGGADHTDTTWCMRMHSFLNSTEQTAANSNTLTMEKK